MRFTPGFLLLLTAADAFVPAAPRRAFVSSSLLQSTADNGDNQGDAEGADLASELFRLAREKNINIDEGDLDDDEWDDEEDLDDDEAKDLNLTDEMIDKEVKERLFETAGGFVEYTKPPSDDDDDGEEEKEKPKEYKPPTKVPDSALTAGEVVELILEALKHNNVPSPNMGVEILMGYSSDQSQVKQMKGLTVDEYDSFLRENEYKIVFENDGFRIDKGEYSTDGTKGFFTARIQTGKEFTPVNFILSTLGQSDNDVWLVDSMLIRPPGMRRKRRR